MNHDLDLVLRWSLAACDRYGVVRRCELENTGSSTVRLRVLDGWHRLMPAGVDRATFREMSYLAEAYMRHERLRGVAGALFTLNAHITDRAEPAESLRATMAWSAGHPDPIILLSRRQVHAFRAGRPVEDEHEVRGEMGLFGVVASRTLEAGARCTWAFAADTGLDHADLVALQDALRSPDALVAELDHAVAENTAEVRRRMAAADALQQTADGTTDVHHFANVLFNCMRGGVLPGTGVFSGPDASAFIRQRNPRLHVRHEEALTRLPEHCTREELRREVHATGDRQLQRLAREYLPLTFSRRHGDPSRPWNWFAIRLKDEQGRPACNFEGNWRDVFQNWEALGQSFPDFLEPMLHVFLNASTADGYNPYRIGRDGIDWEVEEPGNAWTGIGYWGDHQLIYLLRLLESYERFSPGRLAGHMAEDRFAYARVPYRIAGFEAIRRDPRHTLTFLADLDRELRDAAAARGNDAKLVQDGHGEVFLVSLAEKLLVPLLVKLSNFVPEGGIWLNTQRPEWNDANNALAGWGLSMVTVYHVRRYLVFCRGLFSPEETLSVSLTPGVATLLETLTRLLLASGAAAERGLTDRERYRFLEEAGEAGEAHRDTVYAGTFEPRSIVNGDTILDFIDAALPVIDATIRANRTDTGLYHSYHTLDLSLPGEACVHPLFPMLEGQVALLGAGLLAPPESIRLLQALRASDLYRKDQHSYLLYPDRRLAPFLSRNTLRENQVNGIPLLGRMLEAGDTRVVRRDARGAVHFRGDLRNARDLNQALDRVGTTTPWTAMVAQDRDAVLDLWEEMFRHRAFTGRSGTFFAFEGLGSIYWHMVAKLLLAVQECFRGACEDPDGAGAAERLAELYEDIRGGLGFRKTPAEFGAFPTDPYSHTPAHRGAQQPGMTGQVKEEVLARWGELGVTVSGGGVTFDPRLLHRSDFLPAPHTFRYVDLDNQESTYAAPADSLCFTFTQVPVCYELSEAPGITVRDRDGTTQKYPGCTLPTELSGSLFARQGRIRDLHVQVSRQRIRD